MGCSGASEKEFWAKHGVLWSPQLGDIGGEKINKNMLTKIAILSRVNDRKRAKGRGA